MAAWPLLMLECHRRRVLRAAQACPARYGVLHSAESTYHAWRKQAEQPCDRDLVDLGLLSNIHEMWEASGRVTAQLTGCTDSCAVTGSGSAANASSG